MKIIPHLSIELVQACITSTLSDDYHPPGVEDLRLLTSNLNRIAWTHNLLTRAPSDKKRAAKVAEALHTLDEFFKDREIEIIGRGVQGNTKHQEEKISQSFYSFLKDFSLHNFELDMDATLLVTKGNGWRTIAPHISAYFKISMRSKNPKKVLGKSNDGPVPRFVAAVIPHITGDHPSVANVGKHLKECAPP